MAGLLIAVSVQLYLAVVAAAHLPGWALKEVGYMPAELEQHSALRVSGSRELKVSEPTQFSNKRDLETAVATWLEDRHTAEYLYGSIGTWNVSMIRDLSGLFKGAEEFDEDLTGWDVSRCHNFSRMFQSAFLFNGDISAWTLDSAVDMSHMMADASNFDGDVSLWLAAKQTADTSGLTIRYAQSMESMFEGASSFQGRGLEAWDTSAAINMAAMFRNAIELRNYVGAQWNVRLGRDFSFMFFNATRFSQQLCWNINPSADTSLMFAESRGSLGCGSDSFSLNGIEPPPTSQGSLSLAPLSMATIVASFLAVDMIV